MTAGNCKELYYEEYTPPSKEEVDEILKNITGYSNIKKVIRDMDFYLPGENRALVSPLHMAFSGKTGSGKKDMANLMAGVLYHYGEIGKNRMIAVSTMDMLGSTREETRQLTTAYCQAASDSVLYIEDIHLLIDNTASGDIHRLRRECIRTLVREMSDARYHCIMIFAGQPDDLHYLLETNHPEVLHLLYKIVEFTDLSPNELLEVFEEFCTADQLTLSPEAKERLRLKFASQSFSPAYQSRRLIRDMYLEIKQEFCQQTKPTGRVLGKELIHLEESILDTGEVWNEIQKMAGLENVKELFRESIAAYQFQKEQSPQTALKKQMIFLGNPGTGKSSMAELYAQLLFSEGALPSPNVCVSLLLSQVLNQSNVIDYLTNRMREAMGGILLVEEAELLLGSTYAASDAFSFLLTAMDEAREHFSIILSGRKKEMEQLLSSTPELFARLTDVVVFEDLSMEELQSILLSLCEKYQLTVTDAAKERFAELLQELKENDLFENARTVRMLFEHAYHRHMIRYQNDPSKEKRLLLDAEDFVLPEFTGLFRKKSAIGFTGKDSL